MAGLSLRKTKNGYSLTKNGVVVLSGLPNKQFAQRVLLNQRRAEKRIKR